MANRIVDYTSAQSITSDWLQNIAPKYFDFSRTNNLKTGIFGYVNEVMSTSVEDTFNAVTIARREFYPTKAQYTNSIYRMAALQELDAPMSKAAVVNAVLVIKEQDLLPYLSGDGQSYRIEDNIIFSAGEIPFMLDHPVIITGNRSAKNRFPSALTRDSMAYTIRYDRESYVNSLDTSNTIYLQNKVVDAEGERLLLIATTLRQVTVSEENFSINKNAHIDVVTEDISLPGKIANFEVFYKESGSDIEYQLKKVLMDADTPTEKFCMYMLVDDSTLRIHFPANNYFTPAFNSQIRVRIYTTLGSEGNFDEYRGALSCTIPESNTFSRASKIIIDGATNGASAGGVDRDEIEDFRKNVQYSYSTNETICTDNDLQIYWDKKNEDTNNKVLFFKKRDDVAARLYGAFLLLRDSAKNIVPSNTLNAVMNQGTIESDGSLSEDTDFSGYYSGTDRLIIKPGDIFRYTDDQSENGVFAVTRDKSLSLNRNLSEYEKACEYIQKAIIGCYSENLDAVLIEESAYSYIVANIPEDQIKKDIAKYLLERYQYKLPEDISYFTKFIASKTFTSYEEAFAYAQSDPSSYAGEYISVSEKVKVDPDDKMEFVTNEEIDAMVDGTEPPEPPEEPEEPEEPEDPGEEEYIIVNTTYYVNTDKSLTKIGSYSNWVRIRISYFLFTNPYLISVLRQPNAIGYYLNSIDKKYPLEYFRIQNGEKSYIQFIMNNLYIDRNAVLGENFYTLTVTISPSLEEANFNEIVVEETDDTDETMIIRAPFAGYVSLIAYEHKNPDRKVLSPAAMSTLSEITDPDPGVFATIIDSKNPDNIKKIRVSSNAILTETSKWNYYTGYDLQYKVSETFNENDVLAIRKDKDLARIKVLIHINPEETGYQSTYIPLVLEEYDKKNEYYTFRGYFSTDDEITANDTFHILHGLFNTLATPTEEGSYTYEDIEVDTKSGYVDSSNGLQFYIATFVQFDDQNSPEEWMNNGFINGTTYDQSGTELSTGLHTFTNEYKVSSTSEKIELIQTIKYIRSTSLVDYTVDASKLPVDLLDQKEKYTKIKSRYLQAYAEETISMEELINFLNVELFPYKDTQMTINAILNDINEEIATYIGGTTTYTLKGIPMVKAEWIRNETNSTYLINAIKDNYIFVDQVYQYLENNFSIDMKFYNTYGRSRFYKVGMGQNRDAMQPLDRVNCTFKFGIKIDSTTSQDTFKTRFCEFVKTYIESINDIEGEGKPLYIMNLISSIKAEFDEIIYIEYNGMNSYATDAQKIISVYDDKIKSLGYNEYVPEFINTNGVNKDFVIEPAIEITFLE